MVRVSVDWHKRDLDDSVSVVTIESLLRDYARPGSKPHVYQAWIPLWLLSERLWEEVEGREYDWSKYTRYGVYPPLKIEIDNEIRDSMSYIQTIHIKDGNHRTRFWKDSGFMEGPAWCLDYRHARLIQ